MSAAVIQFPDRWVGGDRPPRYQGRAQARAVHDARLIMAAKADNDDWTARLLLALLQTLDRKQLELLEFRLLGPTLDSLSATQALAIVQLATGNKSHREHVRSALASLTKTEAE